MLEDAPPSKEERVSEKRYRTGDGAGAREPYNGRLGRQSVKISRANRERIFKLIGEAETLDLLDLEAFYRWVNDSYEVLEFDPLHQQRFNEYCRSSCDSNLMRVFIGVWILKLALGEIVRQERSPKTQGGACFHREEGK